jgi:hypothetical protein
LDKKDRKKIIDSFKARRARGGVFAVRNSASGKRLVQATTDIQGSKNRFEFSQSTGGCAYKPLQEDYKKYGAGVFSFEIIEELEQKEGQPDEEFKSETEALCALLLDEMSSDELY